MVEVFFRIDCPCCESELKITVWPDEMGGIDDYQVDVGKVRIRDPSVVDEC